MDYNAVFKEKLGKLLFLELDWEGFKKATGILPKTSIKSDDLYIPISSSYLASNAGEEMKLGNLPIYYFIEGMLLALGADENLKYCYDYIIILNNLKDSEECAKSLIADRIKKDELIEAYILVKGLVRMTEDEEYYKKMLLIGESIREEDSGFKKILLEDLEVGRDKYKDLPEINLYSAIIYKDENDYSKAKLEIKEYLDKGGEVTEEIKIIIKDIESISSYEKAVDLLEKSPEKAIGIFLSLIEDFNKNPLLYYYLGVAYRKIQHFEKAIEYLNESLSLESGILEVVTELGLNYACIGDYNTSIKYFKKAFEASKDVAICTNLVMCYLNLGDEKNAKLHYDIAKELDSEDEVVKELESLIK